MQLKKKKEKIANGHAYVDTYAISHEHETFMLAINIYIVLLKDLSSVLLRV